MKAKHRSLRTIVKPTEKNKPIPIAYKPLLYIFVILAIVTVAGYLMIHIFYSLISLINHAPQNETIYKPHDINWFINRSMTASILKVRISELDQQIQNFTSNHGYNQSTYTPQELEKYSSMIGAKSIMTHNYDMMIAEYNLHSKDINRSWNKSIPRAIFDIPE